MSDVTNNSKIITFYSFKGGVGRTMALANTACYLANTHNLNLILVDWDLEAPGLHYYFGYSDHDLKNNLGLIDYLEDYKKATKAGNKEKVPQLDNYLTPVSDAMQKKIKNGSIRLVTCGKTDSEYALRIQEFDWKKFYHDDYGFEIIESLKSELKDSSDITIVDARAGQADIGTTSTIQVPDAVVMFFTSNRQSLEGTEKVAKLIKSHPFRKLQGMPDLKLFLVPSRVFPEEDRFNKWLDEVAIPMQQRLVKEKILDPRDQPKGLRECILGVDPRFTFDEMLPALEDTLYSRLIDSYKDLAQAICDLHAGRDLWSTHGPDFITKTDNNRETLLRQLRDAAKRGDEHLVTYLNYELGRIAINERKYDEAESLLQTALAYTTQKDQPVAIVAILDKIALLRVNQGRPCEAEMLLNDALNIAKKIQNKALGAKVIINQAILNASQNNKEDAVRLFKLAMNWIKKLNEPKEFTSCLMSLTDVLFNNEQYKESIAQLKSGLKYLSQNNAVDDQAKVEDRLGDAYLLVDKIENAVKSYDNARQTYAHVGDAESQIKIIEKIVSILKKTNKERTALSYLEILASEKKDPKVGKRITNLISNISHSK